MSTPRKQASSTVQTPIVTPTLAEPQIPDTRPHNSKHMSSSHSYHHLSLVIGGTRSGKSAYAEKLALEHDRCVYLATAESSDEEMRQRIATHRARRDERAQRWRTVEAPIELAAAIRHECAPQQCLLVDCLTVWLGNLMHYERDIDSAREALLESLADASGSIVLVANEVGLGIVPDNAQARRFRDHAGMLNQAVAAAADRVVFIAAGLPMVLKNTE